MTQQTQITLYQGVDIEQAAYMAAFSQPDGLQSVIDQITSQAIEQAQGLDAATAASRKKLASIAYSVAQAKTAIDGTGKDLVADAKAKIKIVDNNRKAVRDQLDNLRDQIRRPVTEFEEAATSSRFNCRRRTGKHQSPSRSRPKIAGRIDCRRRRIRSTASRNRTIAPRTGCQRTGGT